MTTQNPRHSTSWWHATDEMIEKWLKDRQAVLVLYYQLFDVPAKGETLILEATALTQFCEALIDYVSFGHFRVFEKLAEVEVRVQNELQIDIEDVAGIEGVFDNDHGHGHGQNHANAQTKQQTADKNLIVNILRTTLQALDFNDKYAEQSRINSVDFEADLSSLGEQLANRLDWEDELVNKYLRTTQSVRLGESKAFLNSAI